MRRKIQRIIRIFEKREILLVCWEWDCSIAVPLNSNWSVCSPGGCRSSVAEHLCAIQAVLGSSDDQIFLILYCLSERERIHLMSERRLRKKLWSDTYRSYYIKELCTVTINRLFNHLLLYCLFTFSELFMLFILNDTKIS